MLQESPFRIAAGSVVKCKRFLKSHFLNNIEFNSLVLCHLSFSLFLQTL